MERNVDWSKVKVDTPILVTDYKEGRWRKRHFAMYENGIVYAWNDGATSWSAERAQSWTYAVLAEMENEI